MFKFLIISILLLSASKAGYALVCFSCSVCEAGYTKNLTCPTDDFQCGKITLSFPGQNVSTSARSCMPYNEYNGDCKTFIKEIAEKPGIFSPLIAAAVRQVIDSPGLNVECDFCNEDLCN